MLLMETRGGKQLALALKNPNGRLSELIPTLRNFAQGQDAHAGAILFEAWVAPADGEVRPSKSDQRREVVMIVGLADRISTTKLFNIDRSDDGVTLSRDEDVNDTGNPSPWAALFDDAVWEELATPMN